MRDYGHGEQIGLEPTPDAYVASIVAVFAEVRRVLVDDGTVWLNLGDSYAGSANSGGANQNEGGHAVRIVGLTPKSGNGIKPKDLVGIPWRVAFALQSDGWYLRSDIIWHKPNPMPESVTDRPTKAHEYLFLLTKSERYYYDAAAIAEPVSGAMLDQMEQGYNGLGLKDYAAAGVQNPSSVKARIIGNARKRADQFGGTKYNGKNEASGDRRKVGFNERWDTAEAAGKHSDGSVYTGKFTRNRRTVWTIPTMPYSGWQPNYEQADYVGPDGKPYRASGDCLIHAPLAGRQSQQMAEGGEQLDRLSLRSLDIDARHVARLIVEHASIASTHTRPSSVGSVPARILESTDDYRTHSVQTSADGRESGVELEPSTSHTSDPTTPMLGMLDSLDHDSVPIASEHNNGSRRTARALSTISPCSVSAGTTKSTRGTSGLLGSADSVDRSDESRIAEAGQGVTPSAQRRGRNAHTELPSCKCSTLGTDHFATMPEALVEPCILAGCPLGRLVFDPFLGSGTVGAVAERLGRRWVGTDLSYQPLAQKRTAQRGIRFAEATA